MDMYANKMILAPMVRIGTLPVRLLSLRYGADLVYSEEIVDLKILNSVKRINEDSQSVEFLLSDGKMVFQTCKEEKEHVILQMGTADAERALKAAKMMEPHVAGIDVNMGCPKKFSIEGGMGAALLTKPDKVKEILTTLVNGLKIPVTCKIRILPMLEETIELIKLIESTGVKAIGVHGRMREERSSMPCHDDVIQHIANIAKVPIIANGGSLRVKTFEDIEKFRKSTNASSVMLARAAQWDPSIFRKEGSLPIIDVIKELIKLVIQYYNNFSNTKYIICKMLRDTCGTEHGRNMLPTRTIEDICEVFNMTEYYKEQMELSKARRRARTDDNSEPEAKRLKLTEDGIIEFDVDYNRKFFSKEHTPKSVLYAYVQQQYLGSPVYETVTRPDRMFKSVLTVEDRKYTAAGWSKGKKIAEQAAALVYLHVQGIDDRRIVKRDTIANNGTSS